MATNEGLNKAPIPEVAPDAAKRAPQEGTPANWFSVDYESVRAIAETHAEGDARYGMENWQKGLPVSNLLNHAMEHLFKMLAGDTTESHLEHAIWNLGKVRWMAKNRPDMVDVPAMRRYFKLDGDKGWYDSARDRCKECGHDSRNHPDLGPCKSVMLDGRTCGCMAHQPLTKGQGS